MSWSYCVMKHVDRIQLGSLDEIVEWYAIHMVIPDYNGGQAYSIEPYYPQGDTVEELKNDLERMLEALNKPVLDYKEPEVTPNQDGL